jgi:hypothetical protein
MSALEIIPQSWVSWNFNVLQDGRPVGEIDISRWREKGALIVQGMTYQVYREGIMSGEFVLELNGTRLAQAEKPSALRRSFEVRYAGTTYQWQGKTFRRSFVLAENSRTVGSLTPAGIITRKATAQLPEDLPLPVRIFLIWLALIMWKREADSGAASSAAVSTS